VKQSTPIYTRWARLVAVWRNRHVNLRLQDGSVIVNVRLLATLLKKKTVRYRTPSGLREIGIEKLAGIEPLPLIGFKGIHRA
jgi:hypothetical protein